MILSRRDKKRAGRSGLVKKSARFWSKRTNGTTIRPSSTIPDEVVLVVNVACTLVILRIVARVDGGLIVKRQVDWLGLNLLVPELFNKIVKVHCFLGCLCGCDDLGFAAGESNGGLLLARPRDSASIFI